MTHNGNIHHYDPTPKGKRLESLIPTMACIDCETPSAQEIRPITFYKVPAITLDDLTKVHDIAEVLTLEEVAFIYSSSPTPRKKH